MNRGHRVARRPLASRRSAAGPPRLGKGNPTPIEAASQGARSAGLRPRHAVGLAFRSGGFTEEPESRSGALLLGVNHARQSAGGTAGL
jgi:hypothetical protein